LSFFVSGTVAEHRGWPAAFFVAGGPGLFLAVAALFLPDPARGGAGLGGKVVRSLDGVKQRPHHLNTGPPHHLRVATGSRHVLRLPTMWWIIVSGALHNFNMYALGAFISSFLIRYHGLTVSRAGAISGLVYGCGALGIVAAGWLGDLALRRRVSGRLHVAWVGLTV